MSGGAAAGPTERGGRGRPARAAPDRLGRLHRRTVQPGASGDAARRRGRPVQPGVVGRSGGCGAARRERAAECVDVLAGADLGRVAEAGPGRPRPRPRGTGSPSTRTPPGWRSVSYTNLTLPT